MTDMYQNMLKKVKSSKRVQVAVDETSVVISETIADWGFSWINNASAVLQSIASDVNFLNPESVPLMGDAYGLSSSSGMYQTSYPLHAHQDRNQGQGCDYLELREKQAHLWAKEFLALALSEYKDKDGQGDMSLVVEHCNSALIVLLCKVTQTRS